MAQSGMRPETLEHALDQTRQPDERDVDWWSEMIDRSEWIVSMGDEHGIGQQLPYAVGVLAVEHTAGDTMFYGSTAFGNPILVFADELKPSTGRVPANRQSDGNMYVYQLYDLDQHVPDDTKDFAALPTGQYRLEIMIPLFKTEPIVSMAWYDQSYRVAAGGFLYDSQEIEEASGCMGIVYESTVIDAPRGFVWKIPKKPLNMRQFECEMHNRAWVHCNGDVNAFREQGNEAPVRACPESAEHLKVKVEEGATESPAGDAEQNLQAGEASNQLSVADDGVVIKSEPESDTEYTPLLVPSDSKKRGRSRHDPDELWVHRGDKRMKY